jgi:hypothetical protein
LDFKAYRFIEESNGKLIISRYVVFNEVVKKGSLVGKTTWTLEVRMKLINLEHKDEKDAGVEKSTPHNETTFLIGTMVQLDQLELLDQVTLHEFLCGTTNEQQHVK